MTTNRLVGGAACALRAPRIISSAGSGRATPPAPRRTARRDIGLRIMSDSLAVIDSLLLVHAPMRKSSRGNQIEQRVFEAKLSVAASQESVDDLFIGIIEIASQRGEAIQLADGASIEGRFSHNDVRQPCRTGERSSVQSSLTPDLAALSARCTRRHHLDLSFYDLSVWALCVRFLLPILHGPVLAGVVEIL